MMQKFYTDVNGGYLGSWDGGDANHPDVPTGAIEVPAPPAHPSQVWDGAGWVGPTYDYQRNRAAEYPSIPDQLDMMYHDAINGTTEWVSIISAIKSRFPKG